MDISHSIKRLRNTSIIIDATYFCLLLCTYYFVLPIKQLLRDGLFDWYVISSQLTVAQYAIRNSLIPFYAVIESASASWTRPNFSLDSFYSEKYLSFPYLIRTPDLLLLKYFSIETTMVVHFVIVLGIAYIGFIKLSQLLTISTSIRGLLAISWFLGGFYVGRYSVGHLQLTGYLLIPTFFYLVLLEKSSSKKFYSRMQLGALLGFILLLGSFHTFFQMTLFIFIFFLFGGIALRRFMEILVSSVAAGAIVLFPTIFNLNYSAFGSDRIVGPGYGWKFFHVINDAVLPDLSNLTVSQIIIFVPKHILQILDHLVSSVFNMNIAILRRGWEWDLYLGPALCFFIVIFIFLLRKNQITLFQPKFDVTSPIDSKLMKTVITCLLLGTSGIYHVVFWPIQNILGFNPIDRVPYRMVIYPLFLFYIYIVLGYLKMVGSFKYSRPLGGISVLILLMNYGFIYKHSLWWKGLLIDSPPQQLFGDSAIYRPQYEVSIFNSGLDPYVIAIVISFTLSTCLYLFLIFSIVRDKVINRLD